jgi:hypothetical protein
MRKLILILLAFLAVFTYIRAFEKTESAPTDVAKEIPVEIVR